MVRTLLVRGMIAGLVAGVLAAIFAKVFGEPSVDGGIGFEEAASAAAGEAPGEELVSRGVQSTLGLLVAFVIYGVAVGGILAVVYATAQGRLGRLGVRGTVVTVALVGFLAAILVPFLKYPANPPGSDLAETIGFRTGLFVVMVAVSLLLAFGAAVLAKRLSATLGWWNAVLAAVGGYVVLVAVVGFLLPPVAETPADFPATVLYDFRIASLGGHVVLWTALALVFAALVDRAARPAARSVEPTPTR
jgi:hypothetical protein